MPHFPAPILERIWALHVEPLSPAYLLVDSEGRLAQWGGNLPLYGIQGLRKGDPVGRHVDFLADLLPLTSGRLYLPHVSLKAGVAAHLYLFHANEGDWLLLLDATADRDHRARTQQQAYERTFRKGQPGQIVGPSPKAGPDGWLMVKLFLALNIAVTERLPDGAFRMVGQMPDWFARVFPNAVLTGDRLAPGPESAFLENFLVDAETFWQGRRAGTLKSGIWTEQDASSLEFHLEASAAWVDGRKLLLIELLGPAFVERHHLLQKAREANLSLIEQQRAMAALKRATAGLEQRLSERTANLARITERENRELADRQHAEHALRKREEQIRQTERLQVLGQLSAGIAHDINNILTIILLSSELVAASRQEERLLSSHLECISKSAEQAALLMHQIMDFSHRRSLPPQPFNLNAIATSTSSLLRRLIGEHIEMNLALAPTLDYVSADPGQIEQILMNLAINARDAMPGGGRLTIRTANLELIPGMPAPHPDLQPGSYVTLAVTDTGCGMDKETQDRAFEPYFTTKEPGKGTGLGLTTAHDIAIQSGGAISIESELGRGSTFTIYLPRVNRDTLPLTSSAAPTPPPGGTETILLVEDEAGVREMTRLALERNGYRVLEVPDGEEAVRLCQRHEHPIELLVTDLVMPRMSGRELLARATSLQPQMRVLFISGYGDDTFSPEGSLGRGATLLQKPFTPTILAQKVREVLDAPQENWLAPGDPLPFNREGPSPPVATGSIV